MPKAAPRPCTYVGCGALVHDGSGRCAEHARQFTPFSDKLRGNRHERGYGAAWDRARKRVLERDHGICQPCLKEGTVHEGTEVDHRINKAEWKRLHGSLVGVDDDSNLQAINSDCHRKKTQAESGRAAGRRSRQG